jgi:serine/threonine protein kinase
MIFSCRHCQTKLRVKEEFAGKPIRCPTCKQAQDVPAETITSARPVDPDGRGHSNSGEHTTLPPSQSLEAAHAGDAPLLVWPRSTSPADPAARRSLEEVLAEQAAPGRRYVVEEQIGRGGMGEVLRAVDCGIRREVAVKYLLDQADAHQKARFVEEAQITGQLEHPNIVPIHELGVDGAGRLYFSMKMVKGRSLSQVFDELRAGNPVTVGEFTLSRLLNLLLNVGNALAYAHARQVIHRDLKPANIMIGDFGEVYVMDWGLAKVLGKEKPASASEPREPTDRVATSRAGDSNLTQDGSVLGTPAYMPPEQALGQIGDIDQRSDIYALGAILYEMLTLSPPVGRGGDPMAILIRVAEGTIVPPEKQAPERARRGLIPPELSAVALKALARLPADRYPTVEALHRDLQLFLEGRSVSARRDTAWELFKKLVKRNKGVSAALAAALVVLAVVTGFAFHFIDQERKQAVSARDTAESNFERAENNHQAFLREQEEKHASNRKSAPAFLDAAQLLIDARQFTSALTQVTIALEYDPDLTRAHLLKGQLLIGLERYAEAVEPLRHYLLRQPDDAGAGRLLALVEKADTSVPRFFVELRKVFEQQNVPKLAARMAELASPLLKSVDDQLANFQTLLDAEWPGIEFRHWLGRNDLGEMRLRLSFPQIKDLKPLEKIPLVSLWLGGCPVKDLGPLRGMKTLTYLHMEHLPAVSNLDGLRGLRLKELSCAAMKVNLEALRDMPLTRLELVSCELRDLKGLQHLRQLKELQLGGHYGHLNDIEPLRGLALERLGLNGVGGDRVLDLGVLREMPLQTLHLGFCRFRDLSPLAGKKLTFLSLGSCGEVEDFGFLKGMPLPKLALPEARHLRDLQMLVGMPLTELTLTGCANLKDFGPLAAMPLTAVNLSGCKELQDLSPLAGKQLATLILQDCGGIHDFAVLKNMPLKTLNVAHTRFDDLKLLSGKTTLEFLDLRGCPGAKDLSPLEGMPLKWIGLNPGFIQKGMEVLPRLPSLDVIEVEGRGGFAVKDFWKRYEQGEFKK